jgi:hypothetical protein
LNHMMQITSLGLMSAMGVGITTKRSATLSLWNSTAKTLARAPACLMAAGRSQ